MQNININSLPQKIQENSIRPEEAVKIIWQELYQYPEKYHMEEFDEDQKSDFLLFIHNKFTSILKTYIPGPVNFSSYLRGCIYYYKLSWNRSVKNLEADCQLTEKYLEDISEAETEDYNKFPWKESEELSGIKKQNKTESISTLILALKSVRDMNDEMIKKVSLYSGLSEEQILKHMEEVKERMKDSDQKREKLISRRNKAFYFHRKYSAAMEKAEKNSFNYNNLKERYEFQTRNWIKSNKKLAADKNASPTNRNIAKTLGLKPRTVGFYISRAKKMYDREKENPGEEKE